jgi:deoxycytidylate deaminase
MQCTSLHAEHDALLKLGRLNRKKVNRMTAIIVRFRIDKETGKTFLLPSDPCVQCNKMLYHAGIRKIIVPNEMTNTLITKKIVDPNKTKCPINFVVSRLMKETPTFLNPMYRKNIREQKKQIKNMGFRCRRI